MVLKTRSPRSGCQNGQVLVGPSSHSRILTSHCGEKGKGAFVAFFYKGTNLIHESSASQSFPKVLPLNAITGDIRFQHMNFRRTQAFRPQHMDNVKLSFLLSSMHFLISVLYSGAANSHLHPPALMKVYSCELLFKLMFLWGTSPGNLFCHLADVTPINCIFLFSASLILWHLEVLQTLGEISLPRTSWFFKLAHELARSIFLTGKLNSSMHMASSTSSSNSHTPSWLFFRPTSSQGQVPGN